MNRTAAGTTANAQRAALLSTGAGDGFGRLDRERMSPWLGAAARDYERIGLSHNELRDISFGNQLEDEKLVELWTQINDAQNYVLLGDPAVTLRAES